MLKAIIAKGKKEPPPPGSALFVANKWDMVEEKSDGEPEKFIDRLVNLLMQNWPGFKRRQLLKMNSKLAAKAQSIGWTTDEMQAFLGAMESMLHGSMHHMMNKWLR